MTKIALCLCGLTGKTGKGGSGEPLNNEFAYNHYRKHIINTNKNVDIYIHSWSVSQKDNIIKLYKPTNYLFQKQENFNRDSNYINGDKRQIFNAESRANSILRCLQLIKNKENENSFKYDYVMITRFDIAFFSDIIFEKLPKNTFIISHWNNRGDRRNIIKKGIYDMWFIGNTEILYKYFSEYNKDYTLTKNPHLHGRLIINKLKIEPYYFLYVGEDYEAVRRLYYKGQGYNIGHIYPNIEDNLKNYYLNYTN